MCQLCAQLETAKMINNERDPKLILLYLHSAHDVWRRAKKQIISVIVVFIVLLCSGCASTTFSRYQGQQGAWPISQGSFVEQTSHGVDVIRGRPSRPYEVLGFVEGSGMERKNAFGGRSIFSPDVLSAVAKIAKQNGADAVVLLSSEREFAGFLNYQQSYTSPTSAHGTATTMGSVTTVDVQSSGSTTTGWGSTTPMYERRFRAIAIRYIKNYPEPQFNQVRDVIGSESKDGLNGSWYGHITQTTQLANGTSKTGSAGLRVTFTQVQNRILGNGNLDSGEAISLQGAIQGAKISGSIINTTSGLQSSFTGTTAGQQMTGEFSGTGSGQTFNGVFTMHR